MKTFLFGQAMWNGCGKRRKIQHNPNLHAKYISIHIRDPNFTLDVRTGFARVHFFCHFF